MTRAALYLTRPVAVELGAGGLPRSLDGTLVDAIREEWVVEDRWWTPRPLRRHYFELVLTDGRCEVVFRTTSQRWWRQRA